MNGGFEFSCFTSKIGCLVVFWERNIDGYFIARFMADQLFFKARDKWIWAEFQTIVLGRTAVKFFAINGADVINHNGITIFSCLVVFNHEFGLLFAALFQFSVNVVVRYFNVLLRHFNALVLAKFNFWLNRYVSLDHPRLAFVHGLNVNFWLVNRVNTGFLNRCFISIW